MREPLKARARDADGCSVRVTILGFVGVLWGGAIIASGILDRTQAPDASQAIGDLIALTFGALILALGARTLVRRYR